jgi:TRAF-type zinc finger
MCMLQDHHELCPAEIVTCPHCEITNMRSDHMKHLEECPEHPVPCTLSSFGCKWIGARKNLAAVHQKECAYEGIKDFLYQQKQREDALHEELSYARRGYESLSSQLEGLNTQVSHMQDSLSAMFPSYFQSYRSHQNMYNDDEPITDLNDVPLSPQEIIMSDNERLKNDIETITANIASLELKQNVALMTETLRMQEEMQSLRALCHGLRMQMHYVLMERRGNVGGPSTSTTGGNATPGASSSANAPTNSINAINRMRNWIGWYIFFTVTQCYLQTANTNTNSQTAQVLDRKQNYNSIYTHLHCNDHETLYIPPLDFYIIKNTR